MAAQNDTFCMGATRVSLAALGASVFPTTVVPPAGCIGLDLQWLSGGSAMICPNVISGQTVSGATVPANIPGFCLPAAVPLTIVGAPAFYLACGSSTTSVVGLNFHFSSGGATLA